MTGKPPEDGEPLKVIMMLRSLIKTLTFLAEHYRLEYCSSPLAGHTE